MKRSILTSALIAGTLIGAAGAAVQASEPEPTPALVAQAPTPTATPVAVPTAVPRGRTPDGRYDAASNHYRVRNVSYPVRVEDPAGGVPWVVKAFDADRVALDKPSRTLRNGKVVGRPQRCFQLGRLQGSTFGWVFGDGVFRRTGPEDRLMQCVSAKRSVATASFTSTLKITDPAAPQIVGSVVWGSLPGAPSVTIEGTGGADGPAVTRDGVFLRVAGRDAHPRGSYRGGGQAKPINPLAQVKPSGGMAFPTPVGPQLAEAPAPDPAGGPRWALPVSQTREGTPCVGQATRVVDGRAGSVDLALGLFSEWQLTNASCRPLQTRPSADRPCDFGWGYGTDIEIQRNDPVLARARAERRIQPGRSTIWAQCAPEVERVTLQTPRDVRTLTPSKVGHAILAVYDGDWVDGDLKLTARLKTGKTWSQTVNLGF